MAHGITWIIDVEIARFFDTLDPTHLRPLLQHRVGDGVITRLIGTWRTAGGLAQEVVHSPEAGTPQGGSIAPLRSHGDLPAVLDLWCAQAGMPRLPGQAWLTRVADEVVMGFALHEEAESVWHVLPKRLGQ